MIRTWSLVLALGCAFVATSVHAQTPPDLVDLIGARGSSSEDAVTSRGYKWSRTMKPGGSAYSYWTRAGECVQITTTDGRYVSIDKMDRSLCQAEDAADACPADVSQADRYKYPACDAGAQQAKPRARDVCPPDVSQADRYKYPACK